MVGIFIFVILSSIQSIVCTDIQLQQLEKMVNNLYDTMSIVLKENVKYRKLVKDLEEKVLAQERSIRQLQEKCQLVNDSLLTESEDPSFEKNQAIVEENDINVTSIMNENLPKVNIRLGLDVGHGSHSNVAFVCTWIMICRLQALIILWYLMCHQRTQTTTTTNSLVSSPLHIRVHMSSHGHPTVLRGDSHTFRLL